MQKSKREEYTKLYAKQKQEEAQERMLRSRLRHERFCNCVANAKEIELQRKLYFKRRSIELEARRQEKMRQDLIYKIQKKEDQVYHIL